MQLTHNLMHVYLLNNLTIRHLNKYQYIKTDKTDPNAIESQDRHDALLDFYSANKRFTY